MLLEGESIAIFFLRCRVRRTVPSKYSCKAPEVFPHVYPSPDISSARARCIVFLRAHYIRLREPALVVRGMRVSSRKKSQIPQLRSCLRDTLLGLARHTDARLHSLLHVLRRDTFAAGLAGGTRCARNFRSVARALHTCHRFVKVFDSSGFHILGDASGLYLGSIRWQHSHCSCLPKHYRGVVSPDIAPWLRCNAGGKDVAATVHDRVEETITRRISVPACEGRCEARTFRLLQCTRQGTLMHADRRLCSQHMKAWHKHGLVGQDMTALHRVELTKFLSKMLLTPIFKWYSRDLFWEEIAKFGVNNIADASEEVCLECLAAVNDILRTHKNSCEKRGLEPLHGPQTFADMSTPKVDYCGTNPNLIKYYNSAVFWEEACKLDVGASLRTISEKTFVSALHATSNRMHNWSYCRTRDFPVFKGPQVFPHRLDSVRMNFGAIAPVPAPQETSDSFGRLQCSNCSCWRRVTADAVRVWGTSFHERHFDRCTALLRSDAMLDSVENSLLEFDEFVRLVRLWVDTQKHSLCKRSALLCALNILEERGVRRFEEERVELDAAYPGAKFVCGDLVECDCSMPTDTDAFGQGFMGSYLSLKGRPVLFSKVETAEISYGVVRTCVTHAKGTVTACVSCDAGRKFYKACPLHSRNQYDVVEVGPLCEAHFKKLLRGSKKKKAKG